MDGKDEDAIPYATYMTANSTKEISTLNDVKKRLGLETDEDSDSVTPTPLRHRMIPIILIIPIQIIRIRRRHHPDNNGNSDNNNPSGDDPTNSTIQTAEKYIGMSIDRPCRSRRGFPVFRV